MSEEKVRIRLNIAGEGLILTVPYSQQEATRRTEAEVNQTFDTYRARFPEKSDREVLAMIAFRYADSRAALLREREQTAREIEDLGDRLEKLVKEGE